MHGRGLGQTRPNSDLAEILGEESLKSRTGFRRELELLTLGLELLISRILSKSTFAVQDWVPVLGSGGRSKPVQLREEFEVGWNN